MIGYRGFTNSLSGRRCSMIVGGGPEVGFEMEREFQVRKDLTEPGGPPG